MADLLEQKIFSENIETISSELSFEEEELLRSLENGDPLSPVSTCTYLRLVQEERFKDLNEPSCAESVAELTKVIRSFKEFCQGFTNPEKLELLTGTDGWKYLQLISYTDYLRFKDLIIEFFPRRVLELELSASHWEKCDFAYKARELSNHSRSLMNTLSLIDYSIKNERDF